MVIAIDFFYITIIKKILALNLVAVDTLQFEE